jgi:uncharacterized protein DUF2865
MKQRAIRRWAIGAGMLLCLSLASAAQAQDFFSQLFGGFGRSRGPVIRMPFDDGPPVQRSEGRRYGGGGGQAFCVRTCDGRHFPITGSDKESRAESCSSLCPASETKVVYGSSIDDAATDNGKPYTELPNAFRYRNELVSGCTCNGKEALGLAQVKIEDDPTLRKGDIVAGENGLLVATRPDKRGAELKFSPASDRIKSRYQRAPVVARE